MTTVLVEEIREALADHADPIKAEGMRAYMKSEMPYRGVQKPVRRRIFRDLFQRHPIREKAPWREAVLDLWRNAAYREERYAALELAGAKRYSAFRTFDTLPMLEEMVVTGAWWDYVDEVATHRLRELLERYPKGVSRRMRSWSRSPDMWKRRSSIICQVNRKGETDLGPALRLHRAQPVASRLLRPQGDRLGAALPGLDRPGRRRRVRGAQPRPSQSAQPPRSAEERGQDTGRRIGATAGVLLPPPPLPGVLHRLLRLGVVTAQARDLVHVPVGCGGIETLLDIGDVRFESLDQRLVVDRLGL